MKTTSLFIALSLCCCCLTAHAQWLKKNSGTTQALQDIYFPTDSTGYAVGYYGTILKSTNSGESWTTLISNTAADLHALYFFDENKGFVAGQSGIFQTADGGAHWLAVNVPTSEALTDITFTDSQKGFCVGDNGVILKTYDGGVTWAQVSVGSSKKLSKIHFPVADTGYITVTDNNWEFLKTVDGGETWTLVPINPHLNQGSNMEALYFTSVDTGFMGGWYPSAFLKTTNGGSNWHVLDTTDEAQIYSIYFPNPSSGYAVGWFNSILHTQDSGTTWLPQNPGLAGFGLLYAVTFLNDSTGFIAGSNGTILKTTNGGASTSGILRNPANDAVWAFPNPVSEVLHLEIPDPMPCVFSLYHSAGQHFFEQTVCAPSVDIDLTAYPVGAYWYSLKHKGVVVKTGKILKL